MWYALAAIQPGQILVQGLESQHGIHQAPTPALSGQRGRVRVCRLREPGTIGTAYAELFSNESFKRVGVVEPPAQSAHPTIVAEQFCVGIAHHGDPGNEFVCIVQCKAMPIRYALVVTAARAHQELHAVPAQCLLNGGASGLGNVYESEHSVFKKSAKRGAIFRAAKQQR